jgi:hypothetical protein
MFNLLTGRDDALLAMAEIEGEWWLDHQLNFHPHCHPQHVCVTRVLSRVYEWRDKNDEYRKNPADHWLVRPEDDVVDSVYGAGGWNRWMVRLDGSVELSRMHATEHDRERAKTLGFRIFGGGV